MTKAIFHIHPMPQSLSRPLAIAAILALLALSIGGALAQRMEQRAAADRFGFGETLGFCLNPTCGATSSVVAD
ncbi:MAG: hypothetical protein ACREEP_07370 [Dongiaceae bacterium]